MAKLVELINDCTKGDPTKNGKSRRVDISEGTVTLLREHKRVQAAVKMKNRTHDHDHALAFAEDWSDLRNREDGLGLPLAADHLGSGPLARRIKAAGAKPITLHGLSIRAPTLLIVAGEPVNVVSARLRHAQASIASDIYAHLPPGVQQTAAALTGTLLATKK